MDFKLCGREMIDLYLREHRLEYRVDKDGDFCVEFGEQDGPTVRIWLQASGVDKDILGITGSSSIVFGPESRSRLMDFANGWNRSSRWPKVFIVLDPRGMLQVSTECSWPMDDEVSWAMFCRLASTAVSANLVMYRELQAHPLPPTAAELENWLDRAG